MSARLRTRLFRSAFQSPSSRQSLAFRLDSPWNLTASASRCPAASPWSYTGSPHDSRSRLRRASTSIATGSSWRLSTRAVRLRRRLLARARRARAVGARTAFGAATPALVRDALRGVGGAAMVAGHSGVASLLCSQCWMSSCSVAARAPVGSARCVRRRLVPGALLWETLQSWPSERHRFIMASVQTWADRVGVGVGRAAVGCPQQVRVKFEPTAINCFS